MLEFATIDGARACALEDKVGSLTPKKQADIVLLNVNAINTAPMVDPIGTIVVFADTSNVDSVFVAGQAVKRNGKLVDADSIRSIRSSTSRGTTSSATAVCCRSGRPRHGGRQSTGGGGNVVIVGGTQGLGRELAQSYADEGREVIVTGRDKSRADAAANEIGGRTRDRIRPRGAAQDAGGSRSVGDVEHLVLAAIERDVNRVASTRSMPHCGSSP